MSSFARFPFNGARGHITENVVVAALGELMPQTSSEVRRRSLCHSNTGGSGGCDVKELGNQQFKNSGLERHFGHLLSKEFLPVRASAKLAGWTMMLETRGETQDAPFTDERPLKSFDWHSFFSGIGREMRCVGSSFMSQNIQTCR